MTERPLQPPPRLPDWATAVLVAFVALCLIFAPVVWDLAIWPVFAFLGGLFS